MRIPNLAHGAFFMLGAYLGATITSISAAISGSQCSARASVPSGESFSGRFVQVTSTSTSDSIGPMWSSWSSPMWNDWGPFSETWIGGPVDVTTFRTNYSGKVVATLFGDRGTVMRCRFRLVNPPGGMQDGGTGKYHSPPAASSTPSSSAQEAEKGPSASVGALGAVRRLATVELRFLAGLPSGGACLRFIFGPFFSSPAGFWGASPGRLLASTAWRGGGCGARAILGAARCRT